MLKSTVIAFLQSVIIFIKHFSASFARKQTLNRYCKKQQKNTGEPELSVICQHSNVLTATLLLHTSLWIRAYKEGKRSRNTSTARRKLRYQKKKVLTPSLFQSLWQNLTLNNKPTHKFFEYKPLICIESGLSLVLKKDCESPSYKHYYKHVVWDLHREVRKLARDCILLFGYCSTHCPTLLMFSAICFCRSAWSLSKSPNAHWLPTQRWLIPHLIKVHL